MRARTLGISIACHAAIGVALASLELRDPGHHAGSSSTTIYLVDAPPPPPPPARATTEATLSGGAHAGTTMPAPRIASLSPRARISRGREMVHDGDPRGEIRIESRTGGDMGIDAGVVGDNNGQGDGVGDGIGAGIGRGTGIGLGDGARVTDNRVALVTPPAPAASKARTAKLVYPVREREVDDSELFIARVTIDHEGFVVGAKLVRGFGGPRDSMAADLIWKFRYAPALDDEGRPIRSTFDQRFLVGR